MKPAWNNDAKVRNAALAKLTTALNQGLLVRGRETPFSILLDGEAPRYAESQIGLPVTLAFLVDGLFLGLPSAWGPEWAVSACNAMAKNADLDRVVSGVMQCLLVSVRKLLEEQVEASTADADAGKQLLMLEDASEVIRSSFTLQLSGQEDAVRAILRLSGNDPLAYIAQAAVEAVLCRVVAEPSSMLDADKTKCNLARLANAQTAGMQALAAVRAAAQLFVDEARRRTLAAFGASDLTVIRQAEDNARVQFFNGVAEEMLQLLRDAPPFTRSMLPLGKRRDGGDVPQTRGVQLSELGAHAADCPKERV